MKKRTKFVILAMVNIIWFTIAVLVLSYQNKLVPDALIASWYSCWTVELALLWGIKIKSKDE